MYIYVPGHHLPQTSVGEGACQGSLIARPDSPAAISSHPRRMPQGLEVSSEGRALARPARGDLEQWVEEQIAWAASSERTSAQYLEAFAFRRGKAIEGAGIPLQPCCVMTSVHILIVRS